MLCREGLLRRDERSPAPAVAAGITMTDTFVFNIRHSLALQAPYGLGGSIFPASSK